MKKEGERMETEKKKEKKEKQEQREKRTADFWDRRAGRFDGQVLSVYENAYKKTVKHSRRFLQKEDKVLEIGCGTGNITIPLSSCVKKITAIDTSEKMLNRGREKAKAVCRENIAFTHQTFAGFQGEKESFDAVTAFNVLLYMKEQDEALDKIYDLLKPGGVFLSATDCLGRNLSRDSLRKLVKSKCGLMPYVSFETPVGLMRKIQRHGFLVLEIVNLHKNPPNIFIAAQKIERTRA